MPNTGFPIIVQRPCRTQRARSARPMVSRGWTRRGFTVMVHRKQGTKDRRERIIQPMNKRRIRHTGPMYLMDPSQRIPHNCRMDHSTSRGVTNGPKPLFNRCKDIMGFLLIVVQKRRIRKSRTTNLILSRYMHNTCIGKIPVLCAKIAGCWTNRLVAYTCRSNLSFQCDEVIKVAHTSLSSIMNG